MRRRPFLATLSVVLAGCAGPVDTDDAGSPDGTSDGTGPTRGTPGTASPGPVTDPSVTRRESDPASLDATTVKERLAARDCGTLVDAPTACPDDDGRLAVSVSPTVGDLPRATVVVTVENAADEPFEWNPYDWRLRKWDGDRWRRIAPLAIPAPVDSIEPDDSHTYELSTVPEHAVTTSDYRADRHVTIGGLGPGVYGFSTSGYFESEPEQARAAGALFGLAGEGPPVAPTDAVRRVTRDGAELTVRADPQAPAHRLAAVVVSLVDGSPDARLLPEHVRQFASLMNTLPYAATDGVDRLRYVADRAAVADVDAYLSAVTPDGVARYGFRDLTFETSVESEVATEAAPSS